MAQTRSREKPYIVEFMIRSTAAFQLLEVIFASIFAIFRRN